MPTIKVTNAGEFQTALKNVKSGDTITLGDGNYGATTLRDMPANVSIKAENEGKAVFGKVSVSGDNVSLDGLKIDGGVFGGWIENLKITNSEIKGTVNFRDIDGLVLENNDITSNGENMGLLLNSIRDFSVKGNNIHDAVEDLVRITGDSHNGVFENNIVRDLHGKGALHCDLLQMFALNGKTPHDIAIRGNLFYDDPSTGTRNAQGIFINNPAGAGYKNLVIEDNMIASPHINSIYISGGEENIQIRNNTLLPSSSDGGGVVRLAPRGSYDNSGVVLENNVFKQLMDQSGGSTILKNTIYGAGNADNLFEMGAKAGSKWQDFLPKDGSTVDFGTNMGALDRLKQLLGQGGNDDKDDGGAVVTPTPVKPTPAPEPAPEPTPEPTQPVDDGKDDAAVGTVFEQAGRREYTGAVARIQTVEHTAAMEIDSGSVELTFNADTVGWRRGLISKDSKEDGFSAWIDNGKLIVTFDNDKGKADFGITGIKTKTDYDLKLTFGDGKVGVWLDGELKGEKALDFTLDGNTEKLLVGGYNGRSNTGSTDAKHYAFDGRISDVKISGSEGQAKPETPANNNDDDANAVIRKLFDLDNADIQGTKASVVYADHKGAMQTDEGSIAFSFDADTVAYNHGLVSKASIEQKDDFSSWIANGKLIVQFQNEKDTIQITKTGIKAGEDHDVLATFDGDQVQVWLDGKKIGERDFDFDLAQNKEDIAIGAVNFSASGHTDKPQYFFNGSISDVELYDSVLTPEQLQDIHDGAIQASLV